MEVFPYVVGSMRIALIADIHGNDVALTHVLAAIDGDGADAVVCLGDVSGTGPQPRAVLERIRSTHCRVVGGNVDDFFLNPVRTPEEEDEFTAKIVDIDEWCLRQLDPGHLDYIASFEPTVELALDGTASLLCYHGSPASNNDPIRETTPDAELEEFLEGHDHDVFAGAHTHFQMLRRFGTAVVINCGSVGMAYDRTHPGDDVRFAPWAEYALVTAEGGAFSFDFRRAPYDKSLVARAVKSSGMPHAEWLASEWLR